MNIVKNSIVIFFSLGVTFFLLIFLFGVAKNDSTTNSIDKSVLIKENEIQRWGTIPGSLNYLWERTYNYYSLVSLPNQNGANDQNLNLHKEDSVKSQISRYFNDALWAPTVSVVEYYEKYSTDQDVDGDYNTFNLGGLSIVHQMNNKPDFWLAWKALTQVNTIMFNSDIVNRYYAWNVYNYVMFDQSMVFAGVLGGFDASTAMTIYTDPFYGLDTVNKVYQWVLANQGGSTSDDWIGIQDYFVKKGINMDDAAMQAICGVNSILGYATATVYNNILRIYDFHVQVDVDQLIIYQWGQGSFLPNPAITIVPDTKPILSLKDLNSDVLVAPEFAYYVRVIQKNTVEQFLSTDECQVVLNAEYENYRTLLNPQNMEYFYVQYNLQNYNDLIKRFGFNETAQVDSMYNYLEYMRTNQLNFEMLGEGYNYQKNVLGQLMNKYIEQSYGIMKKNLPLEVTSRNFARYNKESQTSCSDYVSAAVADPTTVSSICSGVNMEDPEELKGFINGTWYNTTDDLIARGFTSDELNTFYDYNDPTQFGYQLVNQTTMISSHYSCSNSTNCTSTELATLQWKVSGVTNNPYKDDPDYTPKGMTLAYWGIYPTPGFNYDVNQPPEFYVLSNQQTLSDESVGLIVDPIYGIANELFAAQFAEFVSNGDDLSKWATNYGVSDATVLYNNLRYCVQNFLLQGATMKMSKKDILEGYQSNIADKVGGGSFFMGADFDLTNNVTPVVNEVYGQIATGKFGVYTGSLGVNEVSTVRRVNNVAYVNKNYLMWNGTYYHNVTLSPEGSANFTSFDKCSNGMQFPPNTESGNIRVYDNSMLKIKSYSYQDDETLDTDDYSFPVSTFSYTNDASDSSSKVGNAYNLNYYFYNTGCNGCEDSWFSNVQVDGNTLSPSSDSSTNTITVQGNTGFMTSTKKQGTMYLWFEADGSTTLAFPDLDGIKSLVPMFDLNESFNIDGNTFAQQYGFVASSDSSVHGATIAFIVLAILFFILGIVALVLTKFKGGNKTGDSQKQPLQGEYNESQQLLIEDPQSQDKPKNDVEF